MTPARMAELHAGGFEGGQVWSEAEISELLARPVINAVTLADDGFALLQIVPPEAELLTIVIAHDHQRTGKGHTLLHRCFEAARQAGAETMFLEVAADNAAARALYTANGFAQTGQRRGYYRRKTGPVVDALLLSRAI